MRVRTTLVSGVRVLILSVAVGVIALGVAFMRDLLTDPGWRRHSFGLASLGAGQVAVSAGCYEDARLSGVLRADVLELTLEVDGGIRGNCSSCVAMPLPPGAPAMPTILDASDGRVVVPDDACAFVLPITGGPPGWISWSGAGPGSGFAPALLASADASRIERAPRHRPHRDPRREAR